MQCNATKVLINVSAKTHPEYGARSVGTILNFADLAFHEMLATLQPDTLDLLSAVEDLKFGAREGEAIMVSAR